MADARENAQRVARWRAAVQDVDPFADLSAAEKVSARFLTPDSREWPPLLTDLGWHQPLGVWVRGPADLRECGTRSATIVGSRAATAYGRHMAGEIAQELGRRGHTIISGLARGIDRAVHEGALAVEATTVAVLGTGVDVCFPAEHRDLFDAIITQGAVVSEYPPDTRESAGRLLARNRLAAALGQIVVVAEMRPRSGTMSTFRHAERLGRPIGAVPGPATSQEAEGCNQILHEGRAILVGQPAHVTALGDGTRCVCSDTVYSAAGRCPQPDRMDHHMCPRRSTVARRNAVNQSTRVASRQMDARTATGQQPEDASGRRGAYRWAAPVPTP
ncbi:DNA-processing protein DprA [Nonomuraea sp. NPDC049784]|uniref:DNA-processing protein DprA n=1 Tax=Nonomuraea sp. NPDC049784 TaxID=3154361 RepID=UPI0033CD1445